MSINAECPPVVNGPAQDQRLLEPIQVLRAILQRESKGLPLNHATVMRHDRALHSAILRFFGTWDDAMCAAGIDPKKVGRHRRWNRQAVIRRIQQRAAEGLPLNAGAVQRTEGTLHSAALRWFPSWIAALEAAGMDPAHWSKRAPAWTRERVVETIRAIVARGGAVNHAALRRDSVSRAGVSLFGTWDDALRAAGLDPGKIRRRAPWTPDEILQEIRRKVQAGEPLNAKNVAPHSLRSRGTTFFGSWDAALSAAGLKPANVRKSKSRGDRRSRSQSQTDLSSRCGATF